MIHTLEIEPKASNELLAVPAAFEKFVAGTVGGRTVLITQQSPLLGWAGCKQRLRLGKGYASQRRNRAVATRDAEGVGPHISFKGAL